MTLAGAVRRGDVELLAGRRHRRHGGAEQRAELHRGQTDAAAGAEDDRARLPAAGRRPSGARGTRCGGPRRTRRRVRSSTPAGMRVTASTEITASSANAPTNPGAADPVADDDAAHAVRDLGDDTGELAPGNERRRHLIWYSLATINTSGKLTAAAPTRTRTCPAAEFRRRNLFHLDDFRRPVGPAERGAHVSSPALPDRRAASR